jgi:hypothetical protein
MLAPSYVRAQTSFFDLTPTLTKAELKTFTDEAGSLLRFRQLGDAMTLGKGRIDVSVQFAGDPLDDTPGARGTRRCPR